MHERRFAWLGFAGLASTLGACQLVSGLSGYRASGSAATSTAGTGGAGGAGSATATGSGATTSTATTGTCGTTASSSSSTTTGSSSGVGGGCNGGPSCAVAIAGPYTQVAAISANGAAVAWAAGAAPSMTISVLPATSSPFTTTPAGDVHGLALANDGLSAFFTGQYGCGLLGLYRLAKGKVDPLSAETNIAFAGSVAFLNSTMVLWAGQTNDVLVSHKHVFFTPVGGAPAPDSGGHDSSSDPLLLAAGPLGNNADVFWTYGTQFDDVPLLHAIGGVVYSTPPQYFVADSLPMGGALYWIAPVSGTSQQWTVSRILKDASATAIAEPTTYPVVSPGGLAVDNEVYWLESGSCQGNHDGKLMEVAWGSPSASVKVTGLECPKNLASDGTNLYFSAGSADDVRVFKVPK